MSCYCTCSNTIVCSCPLDLIGSSTGFEWNCNRTGNADDPTIEPNGLHERYYLSVLYLSQQLRERLNSSKERKPFFRPMQGLGSGGMINFEMIYRVIGNSKVIIIMKMIMIIILWYTLW